VIFEGRPEVVCICGSTRFSEAIMMVRMHYSALGCIVVGSDLYGHADWPEGAKFLTSDSDEAIEIKQRLDKLRFWKIDMADRVIVVNLGGHIDPSTQQEIAYARGQDKPVHYVFEKGDE
jgi:hypothetical protein